MNLLEEKINRIRVNMVKKSAWMESIAMGAIPKNKHLAILLSLLPQHENKRLELEQYTTPGNLAARWVNEINNASKEGISNFEIIDLGCGNGVLGFGCALMGAKKVTMIDCDSQAIEIAKSGQKVLTEKVNLNTEIKFINSMIGKSEIKIPNDSLIISNPPWGTQRQKADRPILELMFKSNAKEIHIMHTSKITHLIPFANDHGWVAQKMFRTMFILPAIYQHHKQKNSSTEIICWKFTKPTEGEV
tara:strand:- start:1293 stop:2030 length:738 start_codon:yes stop_codon:yes gene_type:complete